MRRVGAVALVLGMTAPAAASGPAIRSYTAGMTGGTMTLRFHGDRATGCARRGLCDVSGVVTSTVAPSARGFAFVTASRGMLIGSAAVFVSGISRAVVHTAGAEDCRDDKPRGLDQFALGAQPGHPAVVGLGREAFSSLAEVNIGGSAGDDAFGTRCAGPTSEDLAAALPRGFIKRSWFAHRRVFSVRLSRIRTFAAGGFAGTVTSNLGLRFVRGPCAGRKGRAYCRSFDAAVSNSA